MDRKKSKLSSFLKKLYRKYRERHFRRYRGMSVQEVFSSIYKENVWGGEKGTFYSGSGTANPKTAEYIKMMTGFINSHNIRSVAEIGCGDFSIMRQVLQQVDVQYTGMDVVPDLIAHHLEKNANAKTQFLVKDAISEPLPKADLLIIRQVLQHLKNNQISQILQKLDNFKYAIITEHLPITEDVEYNLDKVTGPHIRMRMNSGVFIDLPPFSLPGVSVLMEYREDDPVKKKMVPAVMRSYLVTIKQS